MARGEAVLGEAQQNAALADRGVADYDKLDEVVVLLLAPALHFFFYNPF